MAEVVSKGFMFSSLSDCGTVHNHHHHHRHHKVCSFLNKSPSFPLLKLRSSNLPSSDLYGHRLAINEPLGMSTFNRGNPKSAAFGAQMSIGIRRVQKWWEKGLQPNMHEVSGAQDLVHSLLSAGDKLVVLDFFSPGCGGCKALHPKICQLAEMNPDVQFLHVNYEEHKSMCYSLNVHVLPFFRFYRGAEGRVCSFSCTNATIKKFRDALAKYGADRCTLGPPKGLEEKELLALAANKDLAFDYTPKTEEPVPVSSLEKVIASSTPKSEPHLPLPLPFTSTASQKAKQDSASEALATSGR